MNIQWDAEEYEDKFNFVHKYGEGVMELIDAAPNSFVVDLGCGNGALSKALSEKGYRVLGIDASVEMIETAKNLHPEMEFGGKGCGEAVHSTLEKYFEKRGMKYPRTFYFPTIGEYAPILEKCGLQVEYATLFDRPTEQTTENGLEDWIRMFVKESFKNVDEKMKNEIIQETAEELRDQLYIDGKWFVDYVRIRIKAKKVK
ncbi:MAG: class I SAM-dependent methyltransferase [Eubacterium sp.]